MLKPILHKNKVLRLKVRMLFLWVYFSLNWVWIALKSVVMAEVSMLMFTGSLFISYYTHLIQLCVHLDIKLRYKSVTFAITLKPSSSAVLDDQGASWGLTTLISTVLSNSLKLAGLLMWEKKPSVKQKMRCCCLLVFFYLAMCVQVPLIQAQLLTQ